MYIKHCTVYSYVYYVTNEEKSPLNKSSVNHRCVIERTIPSASTGKLSILKYHMTHAFFLNDRNLDRTLARGPGDTLQDSIDPRRWVRPCS